MHKPPKVKKQNACQLTKLIKKAHDECVINDQMKSRLNSLGPNGWLVWSLSDEQRFYIKKNYGYAIIPYIYRIRTGKFFQNSKNQPAIIKELIRAARADQKFIAKTLKRIKTQI